MTAARRLLREFGAYRLDTTEKRLFHEGEEIKLQKRVMKFLIFLVENPDRLFEREQLLDAVWGVKAMEPSNVDVCVKELREVLGGHYIETVSGWGYRFKAEVRTIEETEAGETGASFVSKDRPPTGALQPNSVFYIKREADHEFCSAIARSDALVCVKGARQTGKSSLLVQGMEFASSLGRTVVLTDLQNLNSGAFESIDKLLYFLAERIACSLKLEFPPSSWRSISANMNFENYLRLEVLPCTEEKFVWCLDEVDRLSDCAYKNDFFGLLRSWHNYPWAPFTIALAYATEPHLFIADLNQSPFNVGTRLSLQDFTLAQVMELDRRYGSILGNAASDYYKLLGGQPYLVHYGLYRIVHDKIDVATLLKHADREDGPFGDHLHHMLKMLTRDDSLTQAVRAVLRGDPGLTSSDFYRLRTAGILTGDSPHNASLRCELYSTYLRKHLL